MNDRNLLDDLLMLLALLPLLLFILVAIPILLLVGVDWLLGLGVTMWTLLLS